MRRVRLGPLALFVLCILTPACGDAASRAAGSYTLDVAASKAAIEEEIAALPLAKQAVARLGLSMYDGMKGTMELREDGTYEADFILVVFPGGMKGRWSLDGSDLTLTVLDVDGPEGATSETVVAQYKSDTITIDLEQENVPPMIFRRS